MRRLRILSPPRLLAALGCVAAALALVGPWRDERRLDQAQRALAAGQTAAVLDRTRGLDRRSVAVRATQLRGAAALQAGDLVAAEREAAAAVARSPNDWSLLLDHAVLLRRLGRRVAAGRAFGRALALNPRLLPPPGFTP